MPPENEESYKVLILTEDVATGNPVSENYLESWSNTVDSIFDATIRTGDGLNTFGDWEKHYVTTESQEYIDAQANYWHRTLRIVPASEAQMATNLSYGSGGQIIYGHVRTPPGQYSPLVTYEQKALEYGAY